MKYKNYFSVLLFSTAFGIGFAQSPLQLKIDPNVSIAPVSPTLYGLMTEEINHAYDGGLYGEMVRNRIFRKEWSGYEYWNLNQLGNGRARMETGTDGPSKALPTSLKLVVTQASEGNEAGLANDGWWGMAVRPSTVYRGSFYAKPDGITSAHISLIADDTGATLAEAHVPLQGADWKQYTFTLSTKATIKPNQTNHLIVSFAQPGSIALQLVSLFPPTYHDRINGNREDLMKMMAAMHPHFLRLPGGNYLEGDTIKQRFNWKETVGPLVDRPTHPGTWSYRSSDGMGLLEMLEWCEDLHIDPVLAVFAGYALQGEHVVGKDLEPYIQEALDEIEYVTGDTSTKYGAMRARDGHPAPFTVHYIEVGNEDQFDKSESYQQRFPQIAKAIREKYPQFKLIATTRVKEGNPDAIDDHFYNSPEEFFSMVHHYDHVDRKGPKIFVGEWATRIGEPTPNFAGALGDAAWMTGMERNSDLIIMASYAPLFTNVNPGGMQWSTDLIGYDALHAYGSPSYWAQVLFAKHLGSYVAQSSADQDNGLFFWSSTVSQDKKTLYLKLVNASEKSQEVVLQIAGAKHGPASAETLHAASRWETNSIVQPERLVPVASKVQITGASTRHVLPGNTIQVLDIPLQ